MVFKQVNESEITKAIVSEFLEDFLEYTESDVIIVGGGPSGLTAAKKISEKKVKTLLIEANNYIGGGFWIGGFLMNKLTFRQPAEKILDEIKAPYKEIKEGLFVSDGPRTCSKLISAACDAGAKILNCVKFEDVIIKKRKVSGVVANWHAVSHLPKEITCVDPIALEAKIVIDASGHEAVVMRALEKRNLIKIKGTGAMNINESEDLVLTYTKEIFPGLIACGMSVAEVFGLPRMGPTFGAMLLSGEKAAEVALKLLKI
ncbi:MAG: sulfide-dependent adenosine diphosphate thiazole synthase [Candidatus Altiarchaeota archaeon]